MTDVDWIHTLVVMDLSGLRRTSAGQVRNSPTTRQRTALKRQSSSGSIVDFRLVAAQVAPWLRKAGRTNIAVVLTCSAYASKQPVSSQMIMLPKGERVALRERKHLRIIDRRTRRSQFSAHARHVVTPESATTR
jgi:hypothetical protein